MNTTQHLLHVTYTIAKQPLVKMKTKQLPWFIFAASVEVANGFSWKDDNQISLYILQHYIDSPIIWVTIS